MFELFAIFAKPALVMMVAGGLVGGARWRGRWRSLWAVLAIGVVSVGGLKAFAIVRANVAAPPEWDFQFFWLSARLAVQRIDFYAPNHLRTIAAGFHPSDEFAREFLAVGMYYPPWAMLLFAPLGWFDLRTALVLWYVVNIAVLVLDVILLSRLFLGGITWRKVACTAALVFLLRGTLSTLVFAQTNFVVLLLLLGFWCCGDQLRAGRLLAAGICVKPLLVVFLGFVLLRQRWRVVGATLATLLALAVASALAFGAAPWWTYLTSPSVGRLPAAVYTEVANQSLLSTILRMTDFDFGNRSPLTQPLFMSVALTLTAVTAWLVRQLHPSQRDLNLGLMLALTLLIYPGTLEHYSVLLIVPIMVLGGVTPPATAVRWSTRALAGAVCGLTWYDGGRQTFWAVMLCWIGFAWLGVRAAALTPADAVAAHTSSRPIGLIE